MSDQSTGNRVSAEDQNSETGDQARGHRGYLVNRHSIVAAFIVCAVLVALAAVVWARIFYHPGGDPGGRLLAKLTPLVRVIPGFERGRIPWISPPCDACHMPVHTAVKFEPTWCNHEDKGWTPVTIQVEFRWTGSRQALANLLNGRLSTRGWVKTPGSRLDSWSIHAYGWTSPRAGTPAKWLQVDEDSKGLWSAMIQAQSDGKQGGCA